MEVDALGQQSQMPQHQAQPFPSSTSPAYTSFSSTSGGAGGGDGACSKSPGWCNKYGVVPLYDDEARGGGATIMTRGNSSFPLLQSSPFPCVRLAFLFYVFPTFFMIVFFCDTSKY